MVSQGATFFGCMKDLIICVYLIRFLSLAGGEERCLTGRTPRLSSYICFRGGGVSFFFSQVHFLAPRKDQIRAGYTGIRFSLSDL